MTTSSNKAAHWVRYGRTWHIWPNGSRQTLCERINIAKLRRRPAQTIRETPPDKNICRMCERVAAPHVASWMSKMSLHLERQRATLSTENKVAIAERLASIGTTEDAWAVAAYNQIRTLLLTPQTKSRKNGSPYHVFNGVANALRLIPLEDPSKLRHILTATELWQRITGRNLRTDKFQRQRVFETMLAIPRSDLETYIQHMTDRGLPHFAAIFHPNTLARAQKDPTLRGAFNAENSAYWEKLQEQLTVLTDDDDDVDPETGVCNRCGVLRNSELCTCTQRHT